MDGKMTGNARFLSFILTTSTLPTPVELFDDQRFGERVTVPTGGFVFRAGDPVDFLYGVQEGFVELSLESEPGRLRFAPGDILSYEDLASPAQCHRQNARALTPVSVVRLPRQQFMELILRHPTIVLELLERQHARLREQRLASRHYY